MPEDTNNDAPDPDRSTTRSKQEVPGKAAEAACPPGEVATKRDAREAVQSAVELVSEPSTSLTDTPP